MGNYATSVDIIQRLDGTGLTQELIADLCKQAAGAAQTTYLEFLITCAEGMIDAFLNKHYETPIVTDQSNGFLKELTLDLSVYDLWSRSLGNDVPKKVKDAMDRAMKILEMIVDGKMAPFGTDGAKNSSLDIDSDTPQMSESKLDMF